MYWYASKLYLSNVALHFHFLYVKTLFLLFALLKHCKINNITIVQYIAFLYPKVIRSAARGPELVSSINHNHKLKELVCTPIHCHITKNQKLPRSDLRIFSFSPTSP